MHIVAILEELRAERDRLDAAIRAIAGLEGVGNQPRSGGRGRKARRRMSADARRRIGLAMRKRWAERKSSAKKTT